MMGVLAELARTFALLSLVSIGGVNALLPEIHRQVVDIHGWMTDAAFATAFATAFAIANASPGPNVIFVSLIGWQVAGLSGLLVATFALLIPSSVLAYFAGRVLTRWSHHPGSKGSSNWTMSTPSASRSFASLGAMPSATSTRRSARTRHIAARPIRRPGSTRRATASLPGSATWAMP